MNPRTTRHSIRCAGRRGLSLIEMMIAISALAALMSFGTVLLGLLFRADSVGQDALARQVSVARLSRQFRADAHAAQTVQAIGDASGSLELTLDDGRRIVWSGQESGVLRLAVRDDVEVARDSYLLPDGATTFVRDEAAGVVELRHTGGRPVVVDHPAAGEPTARDALVIEAAVGVETSGGAGE